MPITMTLFTNSKNSLMQNSKNQLYNLELMIVQFYES